MSTELLEEIDEAIKSWEDLPEHKRYTPSRELKLRTLIRKLDKYTLTQLDVLITARNMGKAVEQELDRTRRNI